MKKEGATVINRYCNGVSPYPAWESQIEGCGVMAAVCSLADAIDSPSGCSLHKRTESSIFAYLVEALQIAEADLLYSSFQQRHRPLEFRCTLRWKLVVDMLRVSALHLGCLATSGA